VKALALVMCLWIGAFHDVFSQKSSDQFPEEYDELFVYLSVENLGYYEIDAIYASEKLYMPCLKLFKILSIYTEASAQLDSISGYMADRSKSFQLNFTTNKLIYAGKQLDVTAADYLISYDDVFLSADVYKNLFGFSLNLDFRSLLVRLQSDSELPIVKILKQKKLRENLRSLSGEIQIDSTVQREFHVYRGAVLDWNIRLSQSSTEKPTAQLRGALGMELLGGEFVVRSAISSQNKNGIRSQSFRWRYISNKSALLRQVNVGFIGVPLNSQVTVPLFGAGVSNTPVGFRSSYGSITLRRNTQPGWEVEVFVNNVLVGYATADANGDVQLEIPLMYGNTEIQIRYYGPWGEEEIEEQSIAIPFLFVPQGKLEYQAFYGVTADSVRNNFSYARLAYGLNRRVTLFAGHEYFDRNTVNRTMPFASASLVLSDGLLMNYQFVSNAYHTTSMLWRLPSGFFFEGRGKWYNQNQDAELNNNLTEYTGSFNFPFSIGKSRWLTRGQLRQIQLPSSSNSFVEAAASTFYKRLNAGLTFGGNLSNSNQTYTSVNASYQLPKQWLLQTGAQYASSTQQLSNIRVLVQKRFKRSVVANFNITGIENMKSASIGLNVFFDLGWMGVSTEAIRSDQSWKSNQNFGGSTLFGKAPNAIQTNTRSTMGRGAVDAALYLDVNHNNSKDADEPLVKGVAIKMSRGVEAKRDNDSIYRFVALEPYTRHLLNVSESGLQEISWRLPFKTIGVYADPNSVKQVFIPVLPMGELEGRVMKLNDNNEAKGMARIPIVISDAKGNFIARVSSDADGYFNYAELKPGTYRVYVDAEALARAGFTPSDPREVVVKPLANGDYIQDVDFQIKSNGN
jgi:hypothetical protein